MKITAWDIDRFGLWEELSASDLSEQLNVFYGPNEAGKTTLMQFVRAMLYGFGGERRRYVSGPFPVFGNAAREHQQRAIAGSQRFDLAHDPRKQGPQDGIELPITGGAMSVRSATGSFLLRRQFDPAKRGKEESFVVTTNDGHFVGDQIFNQLISDIDEPTFSNVFAVGLDELQQLGILEDTEAAEMLYRLTIGIDRVSLLESVRTLVQSRNHLIDPTGKQGAIGRLIAQRAALQNDIGRSRVRLREFGEVLAEHRQHERVAQQIETELKKLQRESRLYEIAILVDDVWDARTIVNREIKLMGNVVSVSDSVLKKLDEARQGIAKQRETLALLKKGHRDVSKKYSEIEINIELRKFTPRLEVVLEQEQWLRDLEEQIKVVGEKVREIEQQLVNTEKNAGGAPGSTARPAALKVLASSINVDANAVETGKDGNAISPKRLHDYRIPAKAVRVAQLRYKKAKEQHKQTTEKNRILSEKLSTELSNRQIGDIAEAIEKMGEQVNHLRRRQTIQQRFEEMAQYRKELDRQNAFLVQHQAMPGWGLLLVGVGVLLFGILMLTPFVGLSENYVYFVIGLLGVAGSLASKFFVERKNAQKLQTNQRQISMLASQMEHAKQEAAAVDARYPSQGKSIEMRFQSAQVELAALEKIAPLDGQRKDVAYHTEILDDRLKKAKHSLLFAKKRWRDWLAAVGLPEKTEPAQIRELLGHYVQFGGIQRQYDIKAEELAMRRREMEMLTGQIRRVAQAAGISLPDGLSPLVLLAKIRKLIDENEQQIATRRTLKREMRKTLQLRRQETAVLESWQKQRQELLAGYNVRHDEELRELAKQYRDYQTRVDKQKQLQREIDLAVGGFCTEAEIADCLETDKRENLETMLAQIKEQTEQLSQELYDELERKGQASQKIADLGRDRSSANQQLELAMLDNRIAKSISQWQVYGLATHVLEEIKTEYELQRQPETLNETSRYFEAMTEGRYKRVWTPIGENSLRVDDFAGNSLDVSWLSRGTREQLFIAIRLALAATFERHGISLPLVLDDVLVNFDSKRAFATAKTLLEFSKSGNAGRQIFLFTCHEHICHMFDSLQVPVRELPSFHDELKTIRFWTPQKKEPELIPVEPLQPEPLTVEALAVEPLQPETLAAQTTEEDVEELLPEEPPMLVEAVKVVLVDNVVDDAVNDVVDDVVNDVTETETEQTDDVFVEQAVQHIPVAKSPKPKRHHRSKTRRTVKHTQKIKPDVFDEPTPGQWQSHVEEVIHIGDGVQFDAVVESYDQMLDVNAVDLSQYDSLNVSHDLKTDEPREVKTEVARKVVAEKIEMIEAVDEWAEHFFDDNRTLETRAKNKINTALSKNKKHNEKSGGGDLYTKYHEGLVFDVDFFDPTNDVTTKPTPHSKSLPNEEPFGKGFFDDDDE